MTFAPLSAISIAASGPASQVGPVNFFRASATPEEMARAVSQAFLGIRLECAQCHKHPTDRWTQDDYWAFANLFGQVSFQQNQFSSPAVKQLADEENAHKGHHDHLSTATGGASR